MAKAEGLGQLFCHRTHLERFRNRSGFISDCFAVAAKVAAEALALIPHPERRDKGLLRNADIARPALGQHPVLTRARTSRIFAFHVGFA